MDQDIEERIAHLEREVSDLSAELAHRVTEIERMGRQLALLMARAAERDADQDGSVPLADRPPPHW